MHSQHLWGAPLESAGDVVGWLAAMQAQEFAYAKWSVAQRANRLNVSAIDAAFADGEILRTHVMRPTWHFVSRADIRWMLEVSAPRVHAVNAYYYKQLGVDAVPSVKVERVVTKALESGRHLTRTEMARALQSAGISASGPKLAYVLMRAELDGVICSGALRGKQHTYALLEERAPKAKTLGPDGALSVLTLRYFTSRGPATLKDYLGWSSFTATQGRNGLEMVKEHLEHVAIDRRTYWFVEPSATKERRKSPRVDLVQGYDEYVMSYSESRDVLYDTDSAKSRPLDRAAFYHAILLDGRLIGHWRHFVKNDSVIVEAQLDRRLDAAERNALDDTVDRYGKFLALHATLQT